jgi:hypothetical protein
MVFSSNSRSRGLITSAMIASRARLHCPVRVYRRTPPEGASDSKVRRNRVAVAVIRWGPNTSSAKLRRCARCSACGNKGATIQHPGWGGKTSASCRSRWKSSEHTEPLLPNLRCKNIVSVL